VDDSLILDRYRPLAHLGEGGHGSVVLAFDTKMARRVAIKRLTLPRGTQAQRRGLSEARTAALLNHPAIVTVHEWEPTDDGALLVMEHVDGASLADVLDELDGPLDLDETAAVVDAVADALAFAHANGVLHLDLKPANILIDRDGRVKVADFGVAALTGVHRTGRPCGGTPGYMAPEHIRGEPVTPAADQWSFAVLVYEMLTGVCPFDADSPQRSLVRIESRGFRPPSALAKDLPCGVDLVLERALAPDPLDRYPDVTTFAEALLDHLGDPLAGRESLADIVEEIVADQEPAQRGPGVWDRLVSRRATLGRSAAVVPSAWLGWAGASWVAGSTSGLAAAVLCGISAAIAPALGLALALLTAAVGAGAAFGPPVGAAAGIVASLWWIAVGRRHPASGFGLPSAPVLAALRAGAAAPLALGFFEQPAPAAAAGAATGALTVLLSALAPDAPSAIALPLGVLSAPWRSLDPGRLAGLDVRLLFAVAASWGLAALVASLGSRRGTRLGAALGLASGLSLMAGTLAAVSPASLSNALPDLVVAGAVAALAVTAGPSPRG